MARAIWNGAVIAESDAYKIIEGNVYFPPDSVKHEYLRASDHRTVCFWKGVANYYDIVVGGKANLQAAWFYPTPKPAASSIRNYISFWHGVVVER